MMSESIRATENSRRTEDGRYAKPVLVFVPTEEGWKKAAKYQQEKEAGDRREILYQTLIYKQS